jgi:hypothetical protein
MAKPKPLTKKVNKDNSLANFLTSVRADKRPIESMADDDEAHLVEDCEVKLSKPLLKKAKLFDESRLKTTMDDFKRDKDTTKVLRVLVEACTSLIHAQKITGENCNVISESADQNSTQLQEYIDQVQDNVSCASNDLQNYVVQNEEDKLEIRVKMDTRNSKQFMTIFPKDDSRLSSLNDTNVAREAENIITSKGLSLGKAYIANAFILTGMKKINGQQKFVKYIHCQFNDNATSERLVSEMVKINKSKANETPDYFFCVPTTYDMRKVMNICNELRNSGLVARTYYAEDSVKVLLPAVDGAKPKRVFVRNHNDIDKLRDLVKDPNVKTASRVFYNKDYWSQKYSRINHTDCTNANQSTSSPSSSNGTNAFTRLPFNGSHSNNNSTNANSHVNNRRNSTKRRNSQSPSQIHKKQKNVRAAATVEEEPLQ